MADLTVVNPATASGTAPVSAAAAGGLADRFAASRGRNYMIRTANTDASPHTLTVDDPTSVGAPGATTPQNPDVAIVVTNAQQRVYMVSADRFADANGWVNLAWSSATGMSIEVYGPL